MQTLNIAESTPKSEGRLKSLLWPSVQNATDVDYLSSQGLWICTVVAALSLGAGFLFGHPLAGFFVFVYYIFGGMGVREGSIAAAVFVLAFYLLDAFASGINVIRIIFTALLLSNVRAIWLAAHWQPGSDQTEAPPRLDETFGDKYSDQLPRLIWPKIRYIYFIFAFVFLILATAGLIAMFIRRTQLPS